MKRCSKCGIRKPLEEFAKNGKYRQSQCRTCKKLYQAEWYAANIELRRERNKEYRDSNKDTLKWRQIEKDYNLSQPAYLKLFESQGSCCAICGTDYPSGKGWCIDHDHSCCPEKSKSCGRCIRGILCSTCNLMIGYAKDSVENLAGAIKYLESFS